MTLDIIDRIKGGLDALETMVYCKKMDYISEDEVSCNGLFYVINSLQCDVEELEDSVRGMMKELRNEKED